MKKIIITTTFRDFKGNINDKMQIQFLKSLKRQTYQNYILVVTLFGEKNVEKTVREILNEKACFFNSIIDEKYRYSASKVILNGIEYGKEKSADILVDCSGDIILQDNFLETVVSNYSEWYAGISHPNIFFDVDNNFRVINKRMGKCSRGIDVRFFDFSMLKDPIVSKILQRYMFYDWGAFEHFYAAIAMKYSKRMINIFRESKVVKFENNRDACNESIQCMMRAHRNNSRVLIAAARKMKIDVNKIFDLYYIHLQYHDPSYMNSHMKVFRKEFSEKGYY